MATTDNWHVVVERWNMANEEIPAYALGPFATEEEAADEANREDTITFCLLTIDAKNEGYQAVECYWTQTPPKDAIVINPPVKEDS